MKNVNPDLLEYQNDTSRGRIFFPVRNNKNAQLQYKIHNKGDTKVIEFTYTFVPVALRHMGIGSKLVEEGMQLAETNKYKVIPSCPFVAAYLDKHPEYQRLCTAYG
ncbi:MAG: GNAT family N-acetyltransferase [Saprospiraceae bacterium]|jgi:predicted GNAT family acetyltransferase|nr:N-acetyltransferase [Lewinellaceae bacterium]